MSLPAVFLGDRFCASRGVGQGEVGGTGGGGWVHPQGQDNMAVSGLGYRKPLVGTG